jgi:hypothetical protein
MMAGVEGEMEAVVVVGGGGGALAVVAAGSGDEAEGLRGNEYWESGRLVREEEARGMVASGCCEFGRPGAEWCQEKVKEVCGVCGPRLGKAGDVVKETDSSSSSRSRRSSQFNMKFPLIICEPGLATPFLCGCMFCFAIPQPFCFDNPC